MWRLELRVFGFSLICVITLWNAVVHCKSLARKPSEAKYPHSQGEFFTHWENQ
jgi:hypothetical protein